VDIQLIRTDGGTQPRAEISNEVVQDYAQDMLQGAKFPAVVVFYDGAAYWLADGFHRVAAAKVARLAEIDADVRQGSLEDAKWYSYSVNQSHGLRRTNADKQRAVEAALAHPYAAKNSGEQIARHCGVSPMTVSRYRNSNNVRDTSTERVATRNGATYTMNTGNIGQRARPPQLQSLPLDDEPGDEQLEDDEPNEWDEMARTAQVSTQAQAPKGKPTFNRTNDNIEWAWWSWNPVTGCKHDCRYCYARDIAMRFSGTFEPQFHPERLEAPANTRPPALPEGAPEVDVIGSTNVFVCSMADLFGEWVPQEWIDAVLDAVRRSPQWNYIFLTKNPERLATIDWPVNAWVGTTVDRQARVARAEAAFAKVNAEVKFVSCEPMLEPIRFASPDLFNWFIIGGQSKSTQCPASQPQWEWVEALFGQARAVNAMVYFKTNLEARPREYPGA
jgi:protein gp37